MRRYLERVKEVADKFDAIEFLQIPMKDNHLADLLSKTATGQVHSSLCFIENRRISEAYIPVVILCAGNGSSRMIPIITYLDKDQLPVDPVKANCIRMRAARYTLMDGTLYRRAAPQPLLQCLDPMKASLEGIKEIGNLLGLPLDRDTTGPR